MSPRRSSRPLRVRRASRRQIPYERQHVAPDAAGVALLEVDADGARADVHTGDAGVQDRPEATGALLGVSDDAEAVDEGVVDGAAGIEVELAGGAVGGAAGTAARRAQDTL